MQESLAKDVASATFRERCACASLATYFQTDVLNYLVTKPLAVAMGTVAQLMASGNLQEAEAIASATQSVHALVKPALKDENRSYKIIKIRTNGKKRRYQLGNWKRCLAVLAQSVTACWKGAWLTCLLTVPLLRDVIDWRVDAFA